MGVHRSSRRRAANADPRRCGRYRNRPTCLRGAHLRVRIHLSRRDWTIADGLPVATVPRIVADLLSVNEDGSAVARVCQDAVARDLLDRAALEVAVADHTARYGAASPTGFVADLLGRHGNEGDQT